MAGRRGEPAVSLGQGAAGGTGPAVLTLAGSAVGERGLGQAGGGAEGLDRLALSVVA